MVPLYEDAKHIKHVIADCSSVSAKYGFSFDRFSSQRAMPQVIDQHHNRETQEQHIDPPKAQPRFSK